MRACVLLCLSLLWGCTRPRTQMVLCLGTDMSQPASPASRGAAFSSRIEAICGLPSQDSDEVHRLERVEVELRTPEGQIARSWDIRIGSPEDPARNQSLLPRDLVAIEPRDGDSARRVLVRVIGHGTTAGMPFEVIRDTVVTFTPEKTLRVSVFLSSTCAGITCPIGQTCGEGGLCISNASLRPVEVPSQPPEVAPPPTDGGSADGLSDGASTDIAPGDSDATGVGPVLARDGGLYEDVADLTLGASDPFMGCRPYLGHGTDVGGRCRNLAEAWTAREVNVGYFPFRATQGAVLHYTESDAVRIAADQLIALSSVATNYSPVCDLSTCTDSTWSCATHAPPMAEGIQDASGTWYFWGYHLSGPEPRHMGWIRTNPRSLVFVGNVRHTCAFGPDTGGGVDFEATSLRCGAADPTCFARACGSQNHCSEGNDDCGGRCGASAPPAVSGEMLRRVTRTGVGAANPWGVYLHWAQASTPKTWLPYGTEVQVLFRNIDRGGVRWDFVEARTSSRFVTTGLRGWVREDCLQ